MKNMPLPRIDENPELREALLPFCRLEAGDVWNDPLGKHRIGCLDATNTSQVLMLMQDERADLAMHDPPYNFIAFEQQETNEFVTWCQKWIDNTVQTLKPDGSLYVWLGADQKRGFQPLPEFMVMMRNTCFVSKSWITVRNQRGYGTQKNWMSIRQELLYYVKGKPAFDVNAEYTDIPKTLKGYYKQVGGLDTENTERGKSQNIRAGNVWIDVQQVFYRLEENVNGCYAQKPLKSCSRIIQASSAPNDIVTDFFCHSASTLIASEMSGRRCFTLDVDPVFCEIAIRRLERLRQSGKTGWQNGNPFEHEIASSACLQALIETTSEAASTPVLTLF